MKEFLLAEINGAREYFERQRFPVEESQVGDLAVSYFVLPQSLSPELPDFAMRMTHTDPDTNEVSGIFGVSDSVPEALRPYWAAHEVIEFTQIGINAPGRCESAEERVLSLVPTNLRGEYVARRTEFFTNLVEFFGRELRQQTGNYTAADLNQAFAAREYLIRQAPQRPSVPVVRR